MAAGSLLITPALVRTLGATEFGIYSLVIAFASYFGLFDFGLTWAATRYFTEDLARQDDAALSGRFRTLQLFLLSIGTACTVATVWIGPVLMHAVGAKAEPRTLLALALGTASFTLALQIQLAGALLRAAQQFVAFGKAITLGSALLPIASYASVRSGFGLNGLLAVNITINLVVFGACSFHCSPLLRPGGFVSQFRLSYLSQMLSFGGWSTVSRVVMIVMLQMDRLAVALVGQTAGLTYYAVPASLASRLNLLSAPAATLFFARASALNANDGHSELVGQHNKAVRLILWTAVALSAPIAVIGPAFLRVWIGPEMSRQGGPILTVLAVGYCFSSIALLHAVTLEATGHPDWTARNMLYWSVPAILAVGVSAPQYGCLAIALAVASWQCCVGVTNILLCRRAGFTQAKREWLGALGTALLSVTAGLLLRALVTNVVTGLAVMCLVGLIALIVGFFTLLTPADRSALLTLARRPLRNSGVFRILPKAA